MKNQFKYYHVAGITIQIHSDYPISENTFHPKFKLFESNGPGDDNIVIHHHFYVPDSIDQLTVEENQIFHQDQWKIYKSDSSWIYNYTPLLTNDPGNSAIAVFNKDHTVVEIYTNAISEKQYQTACFGALTLFNTDQVLFAKPLCERNGLILHSNGFNIQGKGILLAGASGAGKSTLSGMLKNEGFEVLCDDRMFITKNKDGFWIHGNWCHGTVANVANISVPLQTIFFLEQAKENFSIKLSNGKKKSHCLLQSLVKPFFTSAEWDKTFSIIGDLVKVIDCYTLKFDLSGKIYLTIKDVLGLNQS